MNQQIIGCQITFDISENLDPAAIADLALEGGVPLNDEDALAHDPCPLRNTRLAHPTPTLPL